MMAWTMVVYLLSSGLYSEKFITERGCNEALIEMRLVRGVNDIWSSVCVDDLSGFDASFVAGVGP